MTVRVGVIGAGKIGQDHVRRLTSRVAGARVVAVTDVDTALAASVAASVDARALASGAEVINDPEVDAVLVTSWGPTHAEYVLASIAAGKPVFCEKPLATTAADCLRIVEAEVAFGRRLVQVGFMRRYDAGYRDMKRVISSGAIGAPLMVHCAHRNADVPERYTSEMATYDTAIHELDVLRWLLDEEIVRTRILTPRRTSKAREGLQDPQLMLFETASGVMIDLEVFVNCRYGYDIRCEAVGEEGTVDLPAPAKAVVHTAGLTRTAIPQDWPERFIDAFDTEFLEWVGSVEAGSIVGPSAWDGYAATVVADATVESLRVGQPVDVQMKDRPELYA